MPCYHYFLTEGNSSPCFPISVHLVLTRNAGMIVAMFSLFPYIQCWI